MRSNLPPDFDRLRAYAELPPLRILVINDDPGVSQLLRIILEDDGHIVLTADRGAQGVALAADGPDLVICDIRMPGLDGFGVVSALKKNPRTRDTPFFFLTGSVDAEERHRGVALGADDCVSIPFAKSDLAGAIVASCHRREVRSARSPLTPAAALDGCRAPLLAAAAAVANLRAIA